MSISKNPLYLVALAHPNASLDGVGVALKVKVRQSNEDIASSRLGRRYSLCPRNRKYGQLRKRGISRGIAINE